MSKAPPFFEDLSKLAMSAGSTMLEWRKEVEKMFHAQIEKWSRSMDLVTREEFEVVRDLAQKALAENEALKARLDALDSGKKATKTTKAAPAAKKTTPKRKTTKAS